MPYSNVTTKNFDEIMGSNEIVVMDFWAEWCGPCKKFAPTFELVAEKHPEMTFAKVNTDDQSAIAKYYSVYSVPTIVVIREGIIVIHQEGMLSVEGIENLLDDVKNLDMDKIRQELDD